MKRLEGRTALITGAASGIGKATAHRLIEEGAAVLVTDIQVDAGEATVKELSEGDGKAAFFRHDVRRPWLSGIAPSRSTRRESSSA